MEAGGELALLLLAPLAPRLRVTPAEAQNFSAKARVAVRVVRRR